jgi:hypothetical protein
MRFTRTWNRRGFLGTAAATLVSGEGRPGLTMWSFMLQPGEDRIVAEQLSYVLREHAA